MTIEGKEKIVVERAYDIDDLPSLTIYKYIYIRIELQRNRHTIDADRHFPFFSSVSFQPVAFQSVTHDDTSYFIPMCSASLHLMPPSLSTTFVTI